MSQALTSLSTKTPCCSGVLLTAVLSFPPDLEFCFNAHIRDVCQVLRKFHALLCLERGRKSRNCQLVPYALLIGGCALNHSSRIATASSLVFRFVHHGPHRFARCARAIHRVFKRAAAGPWRRLQDRSDRRFCWHRCLVCPYAVDAQLALCRRSE